MNDENITENNSAAEPRGLQSAWGRYSHDKGGVQHALQSV